MPILSNVKGLLDITYTIHCASGLYVLYKYQYEETVADWRGSCTSTSYKNVCLPKVVSDAITIPLVPLFIKMVK